MQAYNVQGLLDRWIGDKQSGRYVRDGRRRAFLGSYQNLSDARTRSVCADQAAADYCIAVGELCRHGVISWLDIQQALATLRNSRLGAFSSTPRL